MLIGITGGTGFLGTHTVAGLLARGHRVRLLARDPDRVAVPPGAGGSVDVVAGDVTDEVAVARLVAGTDAVLHAAAVYSFDRRRRQELLRTNERGTEVVLGAARRAGTGRVVHVSTVGALLPAVTAELGPASPTGTPREAYSASKAAADRIARRHQAAGVPVVLTYPPALLGPDDPRLGDQNARLRNLLRGLMPFWPDGALPLGDVRDSARLHVELFDAAPPAGDRFFGPGAHVPVRDYLAAVRVATGRRLPAAFLPPAAMLPVGRAVDRLQRWWPWAIPAEYGAIYTCAVAAPVATGAPTGGVPARPLAETVRDAVAWLHAHRLLTRRQAGAAAKTSTRTETGPATAGTGPTGKALP
jgi:dihydroflavonol-4-reductase